MGGEGWPPMGPHQEESTQDIEGNENSPLLSTHRVHLGDCGRQES